MTKDPFWWTKYTFLIPELLASDISEVEASKIADKFKREFPEVRDWADKAKAEVSK